MSSSVHRGQECARLDALEISAKTLAKRSKTNQAFAYRKDA